MCGVTSAFLSSSYRVSNTSVARISTLRMFEVSGGITILIADMTLDLISSYHFICEGRHAVFRSLIICKKKPAFLLRQNPGNMKGSSRSALFGCACLHKGCDQTLHFSPSSPEIPSKSVPGKSRVSRYGVILEYLNTLTAK